MSHKKVIKKKIFNKHFIGMIAIFALIIISALTFVSFIEDALGKDKTLNKNKQSQKK